MYQLLILNASFFAAFAVILSIIKKRVKTERAKNILLLVAPIITLLVHYSQFIYDVMTGGDIVAHLGANPNLYMPLYPCNIVMWLTLIFALLKTKAPSSENFVLTLSSGLESLPPLSECLQTRTSYEPSRLPTSLSSRASLLTQRFCSTFFCFLFWDTRR